MSNFKGKWATKEDCTGVSIESRHGVPSEMADMAKIVAALPAMVRARLLSLWCDSNFSPRYNFTIRPGSWEPALGADISTAVLSVNTWHNGIHIIDGGAEVHGVQSFAPGWRA